MFSIEMSLKAMTILFWDTDIIILYWLVYSDSLRNIVFTPNGTQAIYWA